MLTIERYGRRHWAVYLNGNLLVVAVYKKGATSVKRTLELALAGHSPNSTNTSVLT